MRATKLRQKRFQIKTPFLRGLNLFFFFFFCIVIPLEMENKRSAVADTPFVTIPRSGDWTTRSQGKLAEFHVMSEGSQTVGDGRRLLVGPGARKFLRENTNGGWVGYEREWSKKKINEKMMENSTDRTIYTRQYATSGCDASKIGSRSLAAAGTCEEAARNYITTDRTTPPPRPRATKQSS